MTAPICPYCQKPAALVTGAKIYPHRPELADKPIWECRPCRATVGCHKGTELPLGKLADGPTRIARAQAHAAFDPLWRNGSMTRPDAYRRLTKALGVKGQVHIGDMGVEECAAVVAAVRSGALVGVAQLGSRA